MDLDALQKYVIIVGGVVQILYVVWVIVTDIRKGKDNTSQRGSDNPLSSPSNAITKLIIAVGVVMFLYGGISFVSATVNINSSKQSCLQGYDQNYQNIVRLCDQYANSKYHEDSKLGLIAIGISFILTAATLVIQNLKTATLFQLVLEIVWLVLGAWLILFSF